MAWGLVVAAAVVVVAVVVVKMLIGTCKSSTDNMQIENIRGEIKYSGRNNA